VYREPTPALAEDGLESPTGSVELHEGVSVSPDAIQLFRYSALTFNGHRIHYDLPYATEVEGYAGLVVHGPLQATWLMNAAARVRGETPRSFTYRGVQPWIAGGEGRICVRVSADNAVECWTQSPAGNVAMSAGATW
jgi:3-methylfumaryl-CoA hydratase